MKALQNSAGNNGYTGYIMQNFLRQERSELLNLLQNQNRKCEKIKIIAIYVGVAGIFCYGKNIFSISSQELTLLCLWSLFNLLCGWVNK